MRRQRTSPIAAVTAVALIVVACTGDDTTDVRDGAEVGSGVAVRAPLGCEVVGCVGEGVETGTGALTTVSEDLFFPSGLFGIELVRSYRSDRLTAGWFGLGWSTVYETTLDVTEDGDRVEVTIDAPAGLAPLWTPEAPDRWGIAGAPTVQAEGTGWGLVWPSGESWVFDADGKLVSLRSPYDDTVTIEASDTTTTIRSSQGVTIELTVDDGRVTAATSSDERAVDYGYDDDRLIGVSAPGWVVGYLYDADGRLIEQTTPIGTTTTDYANGVVVAQTTATGDRFQLVEDRDGIRVESDTTRTYRHDPDGRLVAITVDDTPLLERRFDDDGRLVDAVEYALPGGEVVASLERSYDGNRLAAETVNEVESRFDHRAACGRVAGRGLRRADDAG